MATPGKMVTNYPGSLTETSAAGEGRKAVCGDRASPYPDPQHTHTHTHTHTHIHMCACAYTHYICKHMLWIHTHYGRPMYSERHKQIPFYKIVCIRPSPLSSVGLACWPRDHSVMPTWFFTASS